MANDDDNNGGRRRRHGRQMTADERALSGMERRRAERRDQSGGIVVNDEPFSRDEVTAPERVLEREPTDVELEILRRLGIPYDQPVTMRDLAKLLSREYRRDVEHTSGTKELGRQMDELKRLLETPPNAMTAELQDRVDELENDSKASRAQAKRLKGIAWTAILAAVGSIGTGAAKLYDRAEKEGETEIRLVHVEKGIEKLEHQVGYLLMLPKGQDKP